MKKVFVFILVMLALFSLTFSVFSACDGEKGKGDAIITEKDNEDNGTENGDGSGKTNVDLPWVPLA